MFLFVEKKLNPNQIDKNVGSPKTNNQNDKC